MALEQTFSIIKPDGVRRNLVGKILSRFEKKGLRIVATKMIHMSKLEAEGFYAVHRERPFLCSSSGTPILWGTDGIYEFRSSCSFSSGR